MKNWKQKIHEIKKNNILKNISVLFSGTLLSTLLGFFNMGLLIRNIGLEFNGIIFLSQSYVDFFNSLLNFQSFESIIKYLPGKMTRGDKIGKNYIKLAFVFDITTALFSMIAAYLFLDIVASYLNWESELKNYIKIIILTIPFTITGSLNGILRVYSKFKELSYANIAITIFTTLVYVSGTSFKFSLNFYIQFVLIRTILKFLIDFYLVIKTLKENEMLDFNLTTIHYDESFIKFSFYSSFSKMLDIPVIQLVPLIISKYVGIVDVAVYKILEKLSSVISLVTNVVFQVIGPEISKQISKGRVDKAKATVHILAKYISIFGFVSLIFVLLTKEYWLHLLIPNHDKYTLEIISYLVFVVFIKATMGYHPLFMYLGYVKETNKILMVVNFVYIFIVYIFTIKFGLVGVIFSRIIQAVAIIFWKILILKRRKFSRVI
ncbi:MAG: lipopolysaccharide biosynthesis protein [Cetobacterium sp.]